MNKKNIFNLRKGLYIVTGGMGLLGKMHCEAIAEFGGLPVIFDIDSFEFEKFAAKVEKDTSIKPIFIKTDITNEESIKKSVLMLKRKDLKIKGLINNASRNPAVFSDGFRNSTHMPIR